MLLRRRLPRHRSDRQGEKKHAQRPKDPGGNAVAEEGPRPGEQLMSRDPHTDPGDNEKPEQKGSPKAERPMFHQEIIDFPRAALEWEGDLPLPQSAHGKLRSYEGVCTQSQDLAVMALPSRRLLHRRRPLGTKPR